MRLGLGLGLTSCRPAGAGGGGGGAYTAEAVDSSDAELSKVNIVSSNSRTGIISLWSKSTNPSPGGGPMLYMDTIVGYWSMDPDESNFVDLSVWDATHSSIFEVFSDNTYDFQQLNHFLYSFDTNHPAGEKIGQLVINGSLVVPSFVDDAAAAFDIGWAVADETTRLRFMNQCSVADVYIAQGQFLDLTNPANIAKFIAGGRPVYLGADGSLPTGTSPTMFFSRDGAPSTFATNRGTGGAFTLTGTLSDGGTFPA